MADKIRSCRKTLSKWKKENVLNSKDRIVKIQDALELEFTQIKPSCQRISVLNSQMIRAYKDEESFWQQKSKNEWALHGDKNLKIFHASVKARRASNGLDQLQDSEGFMHRAEASKGQIAADYFRKHFSSSYSESQRVSFQNFPSRVSDSLNSLLTCEISKEEIKEAVFSIKSSSAPGVDGMTGYFFQQYWDVIGNELSEEIRRFFVTGEFPLEWNMTQICLIPKIPGATLMYDLRPISLCTVMYKIVANILASRIKPFLPDLVSQNQSAFVSDRMSSDNIIIAHESLHALRSVNSISKEFVAIKSDMSKAYDKVEWDYLQDLLLALGFHPRWVGWIMFYVRSVSYTILINGQPHGFVKLCRGLRQGDPLSPFLFVLCSEGLTFLLNQASHQHLLRGMKFSPQGPQIHHLLFADDTLFLVKAYVDECSVVSEILSIYERATWQMINLDKFSIIFGSKVNEEKKYQIKEVLGIFKEGGDGS